VTSGRLAGLVKDIFIAIYYYILLFMLLQLESKQIFIAVYYFILYWDNMQWKVAVRDRAGRSGLISYFFSSILAKEESVGKIEPVPRNPLD